jgi:hypothetical protein
LRDTTSDRILATYETGKPRPPLGQPQESAS